MAQKSNLNTFQLKVTLLKTNPVVWRKVWLPATFNFYQLHMALQAAFGWENSHLFQFCKNGMSDVDGIGIPNEEYPVRDARKVKLNQVMAEANKRYKYIYDFGDNWEHQIDLEGITDDAAPIAVCVDGAGECPPEDVGGQPGYMEMLKVLDGGASEERQQYREWLGLSARQSWNPKYYNQREVNKRMSLLSPEEFTFG
ncbi:MAG: plasmid pRiA4b ORF-3 family protein [Chitinophagaceae bacterium]